MSMLGMPRVALRLHSTFKFGGEADTSFGPYVAVARTVAQEYRRCELEYPFITPFASPPPYLY